MLQQQLQDLMYYVQTQEQRKALPRIGRYSMRHGKRCPLCVDEWLPDTGSTWFPEAYDCSGLLWAEAPAWC